MAVQAFPQNIHACHELLSKQRIERRKLRRENARLKSEIERLESQLGTTKKTPVGSQTPNENEVEEEAVGSACTVDDASNSSPLSDGDSSEDRTRELEEANKRIREQSAAQLKHFAMMSHEIRTPLNCIIGLSSLLVETDLDESQQESLRMIVKSGDLLLSVVNDVLDYSRLESGNLDIHLEPTDVEAVTKLVLHTMSAKAKDRRIKITKNVDFALPSRVRTDGSRIQQILYNLLGNAVKFSEEGSNIDFSAQMIHAVPKKEWGEPEEANKIRFIIKDYGKGIPPDQLEKVFLPFNQGSEGFIAGGTGLGLAITSKLVKGLNGSISVKSELGKWTEFVVDVPCIREEPPRRMSLHSLPMDQGSQRYLKLRDVVSKSSSSGRNSPTNLSSNPVESPTQLTKQSMSPTKSAPPVIGEDVRILVADDNTINRKILVQMLQRIGAKKVDTAENGLQAVELEAQNSYDVVLMDIEMPVMDGLEATKQILAREKSGRDNKPKVVFVTAHALGAFHAKAVQAGGCAFLTKPFNLKKLMALFDSIDMHRGCRSLPKHLATLGSAATKEVLQQMLS